MPTCLELCHRPCLQVSTLGLCSLGHRDQWCPAQLLLALKHMWKPELGQGTWCLWVLGALVAAKSSQEARAGCPRVNSVLYQRANRKALCSHHRGREQAKLWGHGWSLGRAGASAHQGKMWLCAGTPGTALVELYRSCTLHLPSLCARGKMLKGWGAASLSPGGPPKEETQWSKGLQLSALCSGPAMPAKHQEHAHGQEEQWSHPCQCCPHTHRPSTT